MVNRLAILLWVGVSACSPTTKAPEPTEREDTACAPLTWYLDTDGDGSGSAYTLEACTPPQGYVATPGDCDDGDSAISPAAREICNRLDDDCDGDVDESGESGLKRYWDLDGDSYGSEAWDEQGCEVPEGLVTNDRDCDDTNPALSPRADEICDGLDNDCDGEVDGPDAMNLITWYLDDDGDGWGGAFSARSCEARGSDVGLEGDCDDSDAAIYPGAEEICDGIDNNCDAYADEFAIDTPTWCRDADGDGAGDSTSCRASCEQPAGFVATDDDCDDLSAEIGPGAAEICGDGLDNDCDGVIDDCAS